MIDSRRMITWWIWAAAAAVIGCGLWLSSPVAWATEEESQDASDQFVVPEGSAADQVAFIERLAHPTQDFATDDELLEYLQQAADAISQASDKILAGEATDQQAIDAVQWKLEAFRIQGRLGDMQATEKTNAFLRRLSSNPRPVVANEAKKMRLINNLQPRQWARLGPSERNEIIADFVADVRDNGPSREYAGLLIHLAKELDDTPDSSLAADALNELVPVFRGSDDEVLQKITPHIEATARRLNLPGNEIEMEGTLIDGTPLDWDSYRGKVVLIDFWATDCGICLVETPRLVEMYRQYRDKGFEVVGVTLDENRDVVEKYLDEADIPWPTVFSPTGWENSIPEKYAIDAIPRWILVDQEGKVVSMNARGRRLPMELQRLLGAPAGEDGAQLGDEESKTTLIAAPEAP